jgi:hypothetical protein
MSVPARIQYFQQDFGTVLSLLRGVSQKGVMSGDRHLLEGGGRCLYYLADLSYRFWEGCTADLLSIPRVSKLA